MPLASDGTVHFKTTMFALVRESLAIKIGQGKTEIIPRNCSPQLHFYHVSVLEFHTTGSRLPFVE